MTIIELVGVTGSGKTTLCTKLRSEMARLGRVVCSPEELVLGNIEWGRRLFPACRRLIFEALLIPSVLKSSRASEHRPLCDVARLALRAHGERGLHRANIARNFLKRLAIDQRARRSEGDRLMLIDEGLLQMAHGLFVSHQREPQLDLVARYAQLVPLPDVVVRVERDRDALSAVLESRGHRRVPAANREAPAVFLENATTVFDSLCGHARVTERVIVTGNPGTIDEWGKSIGGVILSALSAGGYS